MSKSQRVKSEQGRFSKLAISFAGFFVALLDLLCIILVYINPELATAFVQIVITLSTTWVIMFGEYTYNSVASKQIDGPYSNQFTQAVNQHNAAISAASAQAVSSDTTKSTIG